MSSSPISNTPPEILALVSSYLPPEAVAAGEGISKTLLEKMFSNNNTWLSLAGKYHFTILNNNDAKKEFLEQYAFIKKVNEVLLPKIPEDMVKTLHGKDNFTVNEAIVNYIKSQPQNPDHLLPVLHKLIETIKTSDKPTDKEAAAAVTLLKNGIGTRFAPGDEGENPFYDAGVVHLEVYQAWLNKWMETPGGEFVIRRDLNKATTQHHAALEQIIRQALLPPDLG